MKLINLRPVTGGTNALVQRADFNGEDVIIKQYGYERKNNPKAPRIKKDVLEILYNDSLTLRKAVKNNGIAAPHTISHFYIHDDSLFSNWDYTNITNNDTTVRLATVEKYCGISFKELIISKSLNLDQISMQAKLIEDLINKMPINVELDTVPSNFTLLDDKIFFVDFMPPKIVEYRSNVPLRDLFPRIGERVKEREERRIRRYTTAEGRVERFNIYLNEILSKIKLYTP